MDESQKPRLIRKIGFGYALDFMPAALLVGFNQLAHKIKQAGFDIKVSLVPLNDLPPDLDLLFAPKELSDQAAKALPLERIVVLEEFVNQPIYTDLVKRLKEGREIFAAPQTAEENPEEGYTARYRGYERID